MYQCSKKLVTCKEYCCFDHSDFPAHSLFTSDVCWGSLGTSIFGNSNSAASSTRSRLPSRLSFRFLWLCSKWPPKNWPKNIFIFLWTACFCCCCCCLPNFCPWTYRSRDIKIPSISRKSWWIKKFRIQMLFTIKMFFQPNLDKLVHKKCLLNTKFDI